MFKLPSTALLAALLLALAGVSSASANVGGFEGADGDQASACTTSIDWACLASPAGLYDAVADAPAPQDDIFVSGSKEGDPDNWGLTTGTASSKSDVEAAWSAGSSLNDADVLELGFKIASGGSDTFIGFELNQDAQPYVNKTGASVTCRRDGDLLLSYAIGGGSALTPSVARWHVSPGGPAACPGSNGSFQTIDAGAAAELGLNGAAIANTVPVGRFTAGSTFPAGTFGEAAVNLDALAPVNGCVYFNRLQVSSRTSSSTSATLVDLLPATRLVAAACHRDPAGETSPPALTAAAVTSCTAAGGVVGLAGTGEAGRTDLKIREVNGDPASYSDRATNVTVGGDGSWSATLSGVADGTHRYVAEYAALTGTMSPERSAVVSCAGGDGTGAGTGTGTGAGTGTGTGTPTGAGSGSGNQGGGISVLGEHATKCLYKPFRVRISRRLGKLARFTVDGKVIGRVRADRHHRFAIVIDPLKFKPGMHYVGAHITRRGHHKVEVVKVRAFRACTAQCANRAKFSIRIPKVHGARAVKAIVKVSGHKRMVLRGRRLNHPVRLTKLPKGRWAVDVTAYGANGKKVHSHRVYQVCSGRLTHVKPKKHTG